MCVSTIVEGGGDGRSNLGSKHLQQVLFTQDNEHRDLDCFPLIKTLPGDMCWEPQAWPRDESIPPG